MNFGKKIRDAREDLDLSQQEMSKLIPMNQSNYSKIERGRQEPNMDQLRKICLILNLDPRYLLDIDKLDLITPDDTKLLNDIKNIINKYKKQ